MIRVLYIGYYNKEGQFEDEKWGVLLDWLKSKCDNIRIYTELNFNEVSRDFSKSGRILEQNSPDKNLNYKAFKIERKDDGLWKIVRKCDFNFNNGITHMYFFYKENFIGELEVEDCENFVFLNLTEDEAKELASIMPSILDNIEKCNYWSSQIDYLLDNELWKPVGGS